MKKCCLLIISAAWIGLGSLCAAPVDLRAPSNTLGDCDPYGNLRIWREIGKVDFGEGLKLPLRLEFSSSKTGDSPYLGWGWEVPLIESRAFLKREQMMQAVLLCGKTMFLRRDRIDKST